MALITMTRRVVGPMLTHIKSLCKDSKTLKGFQTFNWQKAQSITRKPSVVRFCKANYRRRCQSSLEGLCIPTKSFPESAMSHQMGCTISKVSQGFITPIGMLRTPMDPFVGNWRWYAQVETPEKGGMVKESGGGIGKLDAANEGGYFHKMNKSRLKEIKKMLKDKSLLKGTNTPPSKK